MDFSDETEIDAGTAAAIAADMKALAHADGIVHGRELALVVEFETGIPAGTAPATEITAPSAVRAWAHSMVMLALADGHIADEEKATIYRLAAARGISQSDVDAASADVKRQFLANFSGVTVFKDAVAEIARGLGLEA
jgi:hypothetical protein